jgi:hypothetical protein
MNITASRLTQWAGLSAILAGIIFVAIQPIHPPDVLASVTTAPWALATSLKFAFGLLGLLGLAGIYARQAHQVGWLGLAGYLLFSLFLALTAVFAFAQAFILPLVAADAPKFVDGFLGLATGSASPVSLGAIPTVYALGGVGYIAGTLMFGIATFRAGILPRWAAVLLAVAGPVTVPAVQLLPHALERFAAAPGGIALALLGYAIWSERRAHAAEGLPREAMSQAGQTGAA